MESLKNYGFQLALWMLMASFYLEADGACFFGAVGDSYEQAHISWQLVRLEDGEHFCEVAFPGKPMLARSDSAYIVRSEYGDCVYELGVSTLVKNSPPPTVQELASALSRQWKEPEYELSELEHAMSGIKYVLELRSAIRELHANGTLVGRFYAHQNGEIYTLWVYGKGDAYYEIFDTLRFAPSSSEDSE